MGGTGARGPGSHPGEARRGTRGPGRARRRARARGPEGAATRGPGGGSWRGAGSHPNGARGRLRAGTRGRAGARGRLRGCRPGPAHSPSLAFFFLASVPPSLPRNDSSFFILWGRRVGERSGAEDMGRAGDTGGRSACGSRPGRRRRPPGEGPAGRGPSARPRPAPAPGPGAPAAKVRAVPGSASALPAPGPRVRSPPRSEGARLPSTAWVRPPGLTATFPSTRLSPAPAGSGDSAKLLWGARLRCFK